MKIGVLGTGVVGQTISEKLVELGHEVMIGTRSVRDALARSGKDSFGRPPFGEWHAKNPGIQVGTFAEATAFGEFIVNATNGSGTIAALEQAGKEDLGSKVLLDISNPLDFSNGMPPSLFVCNTDSLGEQIQRAYPELKVVKSLNTMNAYIMVNPGLLPEDHHVFMNGNDADAKSKVKELLKSFGWKERNIIDMGDISTARGTEQILPIWVRLWGALKTPMFNFKIVMGEVPRG
ncbi:MAG: NAD(P)-binding domain-containing protein [Chryseosolibacter sp.]